MHPIDRPPPLLIDLYELTMADAYLACGLIAPATFSLFVRALPRDRGYLLAVGLGSVLSYLEQLRFAPDDLAYLESMRAFSPRLLEYLRTFRFTGTVRALAEGTPFFPQEPLLEVTAPLPEAQLVETLIVNQVHLQTLVATKAARCVLAADGRPVIDFGLRRVHGYDAGIKAARAGWIGGIASTSNVFAGQAFGIPVTGTMAHSFVQAFDDELSAFRAYAGTFPDRTILLIDTYDTLEGARRAAVLAAELAESGHALSGVRLDSGDLAGLATGVRRILDDHGLTEVRIVASGGLDEHEIARIVARGAPVDVFAVGTKLGVSADAPYLDMAYKLVEFDGRPVMKLSAGKATWPGRKQVWRRRTPGGEAGGDAVALVEEAGPEGHEPLLHVVMRDGRAVETQSELEAARARVRGELARLPPAVRAPRGPALYTVTFSERLIALRRELAARPLEGDEPP